MTRQPKASVILVASRGCASVARVMECLRRQAAAPCLEVVIAARPEHVTELAALDPGPLGALRAVSADFATSARARVSAIETSSAPIVIFAEDHAFPRDHAWAARLIDLHAEPYAVVGPAVGNANPDTALSWAVLVAEYGPWLCPEGRGEVDALPGHNSAYKREVLMRLGDDLADWLEAEWVLHQALRAEGERLFFASDVTVDHVNFSRVLDAIGITFWGGWMFAASRTAAWSRTRRLAYGLAAPAIFAIRFTRSLGYLKRCPSERPATIAILPMLALTLAAHALGEALGHALGDCGLRGELSRREYDRWRHVSSSEAATLVPTV